jgi:hypothetical protein
MLVQEIASENAAPVSSPWMWTLAFGHHEDEGGSKVSCRSERTQPTVQGAPANESKRRTRMRQQRRGRQRRTGVESVS